MEKRSPLLSWLHRSNDPGWGTDPAQRDEETLRRVLARVGPLFGPRRYFRLEVRGWENLPSAPVMLVSNHSGGTTIPDVWGFSVAWHRRFGLDRPIHALGHEMIFSVAPVAKMMAQIGVVRAGRARARTILDDLRRDLLVLPGGDLETWRPWSQRYQVHFGGRKGYAELALQTGVPVIPVAHAGAHSSLIVLARGGRLARALHLPEIARASIWPVHLSLPWGLAVGPMPHIPLPVRLRYRIGPPVPPPPGQLPDPAPSEARIAAYDGAIRAAIQGMLDGLKAERRARI